MNHLFDIQCTAERTIIQLDQIVESNENYAVGVITPVGVQPIDQNYTPFNIYIGHTNFPISQYVSDLIKSIPGVEYFGVITCYRFKIFYKMRLVKIIMFRCQLPLLNVFEGSSAFQNSTIGF